MARTMAIKYPANCADCGAYLPAGTLARLYGRGKVYGMKCHDKQGNHAPEFDRARNANDERVRAGNGAIIEAEDRQEALTQPDWMPMNAQQMRDFEAGR